MTNKKGKLPQDKVEAIATDRQKPFKINMTCVTNEMLGKQILSNLETTEAWVVPIYDDSPLVSPVEAKDLPPILSDEQLAAITNNAVEAQKIAPRTCPPLVIQKWTAQAQRDADVKFYSAKQASTLAEGPALPDDKLREEIAKVYFKARNPFSDWDNPFSDRKPSLAFANDIMSLIRAREQARIANRPKIICLCGSSRFIWYFAVMAWEFEKQGAITLGLHLLPENYTTEKVHEDHIAEWEGVAVQMDELHRRKIDLADEVFVINVSGYIGKSTAGEIEYAKKLGKPIKYLEALKENDNG